jgi:hypothetical protein
MLSRPVTTERLQTAARGTLTALEATVEPSFAGKMSSTMKTEKKKK